MKKFASFAVGLLAMCGILGSTQTVFGDTFNWTDGYRTFLSDEISRVASGRTDFTKFGLYDIDGDDLPELFLLDTANDGNYKIYSYENTNVVLQKSFSAKGFYKLIKDNSFIVAFGNDTTTTYSYYDKDIYLSQTEQVFKARQGNLISGTSNYEWLYFHGTKPVREDDFNALLKKELEQFYPVFLDINAENINSEVYIGLGYAAKSSLTSFSGSKITEGNSTITFSNGSSVTVRSGGENSVYGLLMINSTIITDIFPINIDGSTFVPVRAVSENLDASVSWIGNIGKITIDGTSKIEMYIGDREAFVNGKKVELEVAPQIIDGSTYVPLRFVSENLNTEVYYWEGDSDFVPIICVDSEEADVFAQIDEKGATDKVRELFKDIQWTSNDFIFTKSYLAQSLNIRSEGIVAGRYWSILLDKDGAQRLLVDIYSGQVFSRYTAKNEYGITPGIDAAIKSITQQYID